MTDTIADTSNQYRLAGLLCKRAHLLDTLSNVSKIQSVVKPRAIAALERNDNEDAAEKRGMLHVLKLMETALKNEKDIMVTAIADEQKYVGLTDDQVQAIKQMLGVGDN